MAFRRCSLCGGKLDRHNICKECGLDHSKTEANDVMNKSNCDGKPLTHVHDHKHVREQKKEETDTRPQKLPSELKENPARKKEKPKKKSRKVRILLWIILICAFIAIQIMDWIHSNSLEVFYKDSQPEAQEEGRTTGTGQKRNPYKHLKESGAALSEKGNSVEYVLPSGDYIVGVHIPEGKYTAKTGNEFDVVTVVDPDNRIYLHEYSYSEENYLDDLRLFSGALVQIGAEIPITLRSENAQTDDMEGETNPVTEPCMLHGLESYEAGVDFEPGVYDILSKDPEFSIKIQVYDDDGTALVDSDFPKYGSGEDVWLNMVFPKGAKIQAEKDTEIHLVPSEKIVSTDYLAYYERLTY